MMPHQQRVDDSLHAPRPGPRCRFPLPAGREVGAIGRLQVGGEVGPVAQPLGRLQPAGRVREPGGILAVGRPVAAGALDAIHHAEETGVVRQPALQQAPLSQQRLVRGLDGLLARVLGNVGGEQPLLDEMLDQRPRLGRDLREPGHAAARRAGVRINAGQPGDQTAAQQRQPRQAIFRDHRIRVGGLEGALDRGLDRTLHASELVVVRELEMPAGVVFAIEALERKSEQRQRIGGAASLDVGEQGLDQDVLDLEHARRVVQPSRRPLDQLGIGALRHRRQAVGLLANAFQCLGELQAFVVVRPDREDRDDGWAVVDQEITQQGEERLRFALRLGEEQLLALVDRQDSTGNRGFTPAAGSTGAALSARSCRVSLSFAAPPWMAARSSARGTLMRAAAQPPSSALRRPVTPVIAARSGRMIGNGRNVSVVARQPRKQARTQERRFAGPGGAEDDKKARWRRVLQAAQRIEHLGDLGVAAEKNAGIVGLERPQAAIRWPVRIAVRRPVKMPGIEPGGLQPELEPSQTVGPEGDLDGLAHPRQHDGECPALPHGRDAHELPFPRHDRGQLAWRNVLDQDAEQPLAQVTHQPKLVPAPFRAEPGARDQEQHRLATIRRVAAAPLPSALPP